jgi:glycosyltransferase involved in cell wall biosynthesis
MQVAIIARTAKRKGGTETYLFDLVRGFRQAGHSVDVFTAVDGKRSAAREAGATVHVSPVGLVPSSIRPWVFRAALRTRFNRQRYDLTISLARLNGQDLAICGGTHRGYLRATGRAAGLRDRLEIALEERCYCESGLLVAHSFRMRQELIELYGVAPAKIQVIHPPVDSSVYYPSGAATLPMNKQRFGLSTGRTTLLFPSTGHQRKGLPLLLDTLASLPAAEFELAVAGSDSGKFRQLENVKYLGFIENMADLYRAVDFTILPAHYEPYGLIVTESMACGTPVITHAHVGACDVLLPDEGVIVDELTLPVLRAAILSARQRTFCIHPNFVRERGLELSQHIKRLMLARGVYGRCA